MLADDVVRDPKDDELDRLGFAKALAHAILTMDVESPFVFSIEGDWGTGKSTVLEFVRYYLSHRSEIGPKVPLEVDPIVVEFSPWWFSRGEDLLRQFLVQVSLRLRRDRRIASKLSDLPNLLDTMAVMLSSGSAVMPYGLKASFLVKVMAAVARWITRTRDIASVRTEIERTLRDQNSRIVIFLDDVDRLQPQELLQVFQVVKAVASLSRLIYVLSFDRRVITESLNKAGIPDADQYLQKIVQSVWSLPSPDALGIARLTEGVVKQLVEETPNDLWQGDRWQELYLSGLRDLMRTPRDVKRVANALRPCYPPVKSEVNAVDFIGFHALRVLVPNAYTFIVSNRGWLTNSEIEFFRNDDDERKAYNLAIDAMLETLSGWQKEPVSKMLEAMFPICDRRNRRRSFSGDSQARWRRECRICSPDRFDFYDRLGIPASAISSAELSRILRPPSVEAFRTDLERLAAERAFDGSTKLKKFLEYAVGAATKTLSSQERHGLLERIFAVADGFISKLDPPSLPFFSYDWQFAYLINAIIGLLPKGDERLVSVRNAWSNGTAVSLMVRCFVLWEDGQKRYEAGDVTALTYFDDRELSALKTVLLSRIKDLAKVGSLAQTPLLDFVLHFWDEHEVGAGTQWASIVARTDEGLADLAVGTLCPCSPMVRDPVYRSKPALLERWAGVGTDEAVGRCENILTSQPAWLSKVHMVARGAFIDEVRNPRDEFGLPVRAVD